MLFAGVMSGAMDSVNAAFDVSVNQFPVDHAILLDLTGFVCNGLNNDAIMAYNFLVDLIGQLTKTTECLGSHDTYLNDIQNN